MMAWGQNNLGQNGQPPLKKFPTSDLGMFGKVIMVISWMVIACTFPISLFFCFKSLKEYERAVIFRLGRFHSDHSRGIFFVVPFVESYVTVDLRPRAFNFTAFEALSKDNIRLRIDTQIWSRVSKAGVWALNTSKKCPPHQSHLPTQQLAKAQLTNVMASRNLHDIMTGRDYVSTTVQSLMNESTETWGIRIERVDILNIQVERSLAAEKARTEPPRETVVIAVKAERNPATRALKSTLDM